MDQGLRTYAWYGMPDTARAMLALPGILEDPYLPIGVSLTVIRID